MPVTNVKGLARMSQMTAATLPGWLTALFDGLDDDPDTRRLIACSVAAEMCAKLEERGFFRLPLLHPETGPISSSPSAGCWVRACLSAAKPSRKVAP